MTLKISWSIKNCFSLTIFDGKMYCERDFWKGGQNAVQLNSVQRAQSKRKLNETVLRESTCVSFQLFYFFSFSHLGSNKTLSMSADSVFSKEIPAREPDPPPSIAALKSSVRSMEALPHQTALTVRVRLHGVKANAKADRLQVGS